jgi:beta-lactamase class A
MIAALKKTDVNSSFLNQKVHYKERVDENFTPNIKDVDLIKIGNYYTILQLIESMVIHSDNEAKELLIQAVGDFYIVKVMEEIGVDIKNDNLSQDFISVKEYSSFFRLLYNATYLSRDMSEKALQILSKSTFNGGIKSGLPHGIIVANKFGERGFADKDLKQLHDCGIVYYKNSPYLLCIMTKGNDFNSLSTIIQGISQIVYNNVNKTVK